MKTFLLLLSFLFLTQFLFSEESLLKNALDFEKKGEYVDAIKCLKSYSGVIKNVDDKEKIQLKIARLTEDYELSVKEYEKFLIDYPKSRFRFFARFELAGIYFSNNNLIKSKEQYYKLAELSRGTPYWQNSLIEAGKIEIIHENYKKALNNIYNLMNEIDDYEEIGVSYFLLGLIASKQKSYLDAEEFFLIGAGSFPQSSKAAASLLELLKIYLETDKISKALKTGKMINEFYTDSPENYESYRVLKGIDSSLYKKEEDIELINLNENPEIKKRTIRRLREDLKLSKNLQDNVVIVDSGKKIFVQLGFYSQKDNAVDRVKVCSDKGVKDVLLRDGKSDKSGKMFYRVLIGPFKSREAANEKLIELKEKDIESIVLELDNE